jgi:hypothetical protein
MPLGAAARSARGLLMGAASGLSRIALCGLTGLSLCGGAVFLFGAAWDAQRVAANLLVAGYGVLGLGLGGGVLLALLSVTGARWSDVLRPIAEKLTLLVPIGGAGVWLVLLACPWLYPWTASAAEPASVFQGVWLSRPFFLLRAAVYLGLWLGLTLLLVRASRRDRAAGVRISAAFLVVFALTCWLASVDWIMSLEPRWTSAVFGIYHFAGMFLGALAAVIVLAVWLDYRGMFAGRFTRGHRRDLGTLLFAFSSFWMYIWFCQYLLIWYVNNPEEADYYVLRQREPWLPLVIANLVLGWGLPFLILLLRPAKESSFVLLIVAVGVLVGRWLDLYLMILPPVSGSGAALSDAGLFLGAAGLAVVVLARRMPAGFGPVEHVS